ncbi:MAG: hypothetical protein ACKOTB_07335, partial [Planctomycetia bacterium]
MTKRAWPSRTSSGLAVRRLLVGGLTMCCIVTFGLEPAAADRDGAKEGPAAAEAFDFGQDIVPLLSRHGCNAGGCHGKASGQN